MPITNRPFRLALVSGSNEFTGSIQKIQVASPTSASLTRLEYGDQGSATSVVSASDFPTGLGPFDSGISIDGPIKQFKGDTGAWFVYHRG